MAKLNISNKETLNSVLNKLTPSWVNCFDEDTLTKAQVKKSSDRNYALGKIINTPFIELTKASCGFKVGAIVCLADIYNDESAMNVASLIIWRLANPSGLVNQPKIVKA